MSDKFVVIGAGPAGLTAAYKILQDIPDARVDVFESTDRIGGISTTVEYRGNRIDIGGHRFFSKMQAVNDFWWSIMPLQGSGSRDDIILGTGKEFAVGGPDPEKTDAVMLLRRRVSRIFYRRRFFDYPIALKARTFINMGFFNTILAGISFMYSSVIKRKENSLEDFYINRFGRHLYRMFFEDYTEKVWGVHPSKLSASWGAQRVKELSVAAVLREAVRKIFRKNYKTDQTSLIEQFFYPKLGPGQLWSLVAEKIQAAGGRIHFNQKLHEIFLENGRITAVKASDQDQPFACDTVLSTMPIRDLICAIKPAGQVPGDVFKAAAALPYRDFITVGLLVKKLKLVNKTNFKTLQNIVPDCWIYIQERDVRIGRLQLFNNWSPYMVKDVENTIWIGLEYFCTEGDDLWNLSREDCIRLGIEELVKISIIDREDVLDATHVKIEKAYPAYFGSYSEMDSIRNYLDTITNLYCLGRNGQHRYNNMDHSMLTAMRAIELIKAGGGDKSAVWNVNAEKEYHEEK
ncbi:MAG: NAD(P)/FAD-dependent oxidoreductase [Spirochaetota bacterium]|jgi:protoporphyrinogen oxidase|nr:NAD(P)/FAD-dependent oxidoreductase [Spirochaetota bacterium]